MKFNISKGKQKSAIRFVCYGPEGIGKSTFASEPGKIFKLSNTKCAVRIKKTVTVTADINNRCLFKAVIS